MIRMASFSLALVAMAVSPQQVAAQSLTAFKTGERATGMTKQCFYNGLGSTYTRTVSAVELCPLSIQVQNQQSYNTNPQPQARQGMAAFKLGEQTTGMTKQCYYNGLGQTYVRTISSVALCPLSINVP